MSDSNIACILLGVTGTIFVIGFGIVIYINVAAVIKSHINKRVEQSFRSRFPNNQNNDRG